MPIKLTQEERRNFTAAFLPESPKLTVKTFYELETNHEMWRTCNSCGNQWDAIMDGYFTCPKCGSTDLRSGKKQNNE